MPETATPHFFSRFLRSSLGQAVVGIAVALAMIATIWQIKTTRNDSVYQTYRRDELVQSLGRIESETRKLESENSRLEDTKAKLQSGIDRDATAREEINKRISTLGVLAGTVGATGPGVRVLIDADPQKVTSVMVMDTVGELRDAGAEAIEINDSIRVVGQTWFATRDGALVVSGREITFPLVIEAIGDPHSLDQGLRFRGGAVSQIESGHVGGRVSIITDQQILISSTVTPIELHYGKPSR